MHAGRRRGRSEVGRSRLKTFELREARKRIQLLEQENEVVVPMNRITRSLSFRFGGAAAHTRSGLTSGTKGHVMDPSEDPDRPLITGFDWMLSCTTDFESTLAFVRDVFGLAIFKQGIAQTDTQFARYAVAVFPSGAVLEVVEPVQAVKHLHGRQILCLTVRNVVDARRELERRGAVFASDIFHDGEGLGWTYVLAPDGNVYQVYGPVTDEDGISSDDSAPPSRRPHPAT